MSNIKHKKKSKNNAKHQLNESLWWHQIMSDEHICYVRQKSNGVIHDKRCMKIRTMPDSEFVPVETFDKNFQMEGCCRKQICIRQGAKDPKYTYKYIEFFNKAKASEHDISDIYLEHGCKSELTSNILTLWHRDDTWQIKLLNKDGKVCLLHNNYRKFSDGSREFVPGFHVQNDSCRVTTFHHAWNVISAYDYAFHMNEAEEKKEQDLFEVSSEQNDILEKNLVKSDKNQNDNPSNHFDHINRLKKLLLNLITFVKKVVKSCKRK